MEEKEVLSKDEKLRISMEETYRFECKQALESKEKKQTKTNKVWEFLNSTLGIWFLSTCVVGVITFLYAEQQEKERAKAAQEQYSIEEARHNASMVTVLLPYLASDEEKEWRIAIEVTKYLKLEGKLPEELESALKGIVQASTNIPKDSLTQQAKVNAAAAVIDLQTEKVQENRTGLNNLPARVYIQIASEGQRIMAKSLQARLRAENFLAPGIENVGSKAAIPKEIEVRYYRDEEKDEAIRIINLLKNFNPGLSVKSTPQKIPGTGRGTRPRHYEIWFSRT